MKENPLNSTWYFPNKGLQVNSVSISDDGSRCAFGTSFERGSGHFDTFLFDGTGHQIWKKPISDNESYQGVFWVSVSGDGQFVASGGETTEYYSAGNPQGFLKAYNAESGTELLSVTPDHRVNQVSLSYDGQYLAVCFGKSVEIYRLNDNSTAYTKIYNKSDLTFNINSCIVSHDGGTVIASGIEYIDSNDGQTTTTKGKVFSFSISESSVSSLGICNLETGSMRVAVTQSGYFWAASLHDGSCLMIKRDKPDSIEWQYTPENPDLELAYAVDITQTDDGDVYLACGANLKVTTINGNSSPGGLLYLLKSVRMVYEDEQYPDPYFKGILQWSSTIQYGVNPGVSMDKNATYVTATDGKPDGQTVKESAGSFYLFDASTGQQIWKKDTTQMNWPMMLAQDGTSVFGGSDEGSVYYWDLEN